MRFLKPKFWENKSDIIANLLRPISLLFYIITTLKKSLINSRKFKIPVICVGNIYVGGTGKTPISIMIANSLELKKKNPVIIKNLILKRNRVQAIEKAEKENFNVAILDDGFQDYTVKKDLNIICFNSKQLIGNGFVFPAGPMREDISSLKRAQIIIINGKKDEAFEKDILEISKNIKIFYSKYLPKNIEQFKNKKLFAFAGIGNPENFFELLSSYKLDVKKKINFPDHYDFKNKEIDLMIENAIKNNYELITTEKDYYRIKDLGFKKIGYLKVEVEIEEKDKLINELMKYL